MVNSPDYILFLEAGQQGPDGKWWYVIQTIPSVHLEQAAIGPWGVLEITAASMIYEMERTLGTTYFDPPSLVWRVNTLTAPETTIA